MKVLAVHPGPLMYTKIYMQLEPLGLELVAQAARQAGHQVHLSTYKRKPTQITSRPSTDGSPMLWLSPVLIWPMCQKS